MWAKMPMFLSRSILVMLKFLDKVAGKFHVPSATEKPEFFGTVAYVEAVFLD